MTPARWQRLKQVFTEALDQAPEARQQFIVRACNADADLVREARRLLSEYERADGTLSSPIFLLRQSPPRFLPSMLVARRFQIVRLIARGGMGDVYEAYDLELRERVALKTIRPDVAGDDVGLELFKKEIQIARRVTHLNVCRIYDLAQHREPMADGGDQVTLFLTMELLHGRTLSEHLRENGSFTLSAAFPLIEQMAAALQAAHDAGVVHRDFKPGNVMLIPNPDTGRFRVVVTDFGLAIPYQTPETTPVAAAAGTPAYMAPEQARGEAVGTATDVYAFGLVIADLIGARPIPTRLTRLKSLGHGAPPASMAENIRLPGRWRRWRPVLLRCLETVPEHRYSRPVEVVEALRAATAPPLKFGRRATLSAGPLIAAALSIGLLFKQQTATPARPKSTMYRRLGPETWQTRYWRPSPDGRYFVVTQFPVGQLALLESATGKTINLTVSSAGSADGGAIFSANGRQVAYSWTNANEHGRTEVRLVNTDGSGHRLVYSDATLRRCTPLDWSPDGRWLLVKFELESFRQQIAIVSLPEGIVSYPNLARAEECQNAVFSPDGKKLLFSRYLKEHELGSEIVAQPLDGPASTVIGDTANNVLIGLSPDRRRMLFSSDRKGVNGLWAIPISNFGLQGVPEELLHDIGRFEPIGLTRDGSFYYSQMLDSVDVYTAEIDTRDAKLVSRPERVTNRIVGSSHGANWSADGRWLAFISSFYPQRTVVAMHSLETGTTRLIRPSLAIFDHPQWARSRNWIWMPGTDRTGNSGIFKVDWRTGDAALAVSKQSLGSGELAGVWSRDGKTIFNRFWNEGRGIFRYDVSTKRRIMLYVPGPNVHVGLANLALSPDERTLAFQAIRFPGPERSLMLMPSSGGAAHPILTIRDPEQFFSGAFAWTPDSQQILALRTRDSVSELWLVPVDGKLARRIDFPKMLMLGLRMNPDGKTIAFTAGEERSERWVAENLLPPK